MLIVMDASASPQMIEKVCEAIREMGLTAHPMPGAQRTAIGITGNKEQVDADRILSLLGVRDIIHVTAPFKLVSREFYPENSIIRVGDVEFGGKDFVVMAGPCSIENRDQAMIIAEKVTEHGARIFRGGAFKPRTSPYSFQGLGQDGLDILAEVREKFGLLIITEAIDTETIDLVASYTDIIQIGARNMQNYSLLRKAGRAKKAILLKRGIAATLTELLMAAEYIMSEGNRDVILCERGVRTFADHTRNTLDLSAVPYVKRLSHLPIITDPSHGTGKKTKVNPLSRASLAVGADGLLIEVHHEPENALSDGPQSITPDAFGELMTDLRRIAPSIDRIVP